MSTPGSAAVFASAAHAFADQVRSLADADWAGPGLGDWDLRALVGHTSRSLITVSTYLKAPAAQVDVADAVDYYVQIRGYLTGSGAGDVTERGRQAGRDLGDDPVATVDRLVTTALADVAAAGSTDPAIAVVGGLGIRLSDYLQTRTFELAVHGLDIARATGADWAPPPAALSEATALAARVAVALGQGETVLMALTGRDALPQPFSMV